MRVSAKKYSHVISFKAYKHTENYSLEGVYFHCEA